MAGDSPVRSLGNTLLALIALTALYLGPMYAVGHWHAAAAACAAVFAAGAITLRFTWYAPLARESRTR